MMKNTIFISFIPLIISYIFMQSIFSVDLEEVKMHNLDNCVIIVLNTLYCRDCFDQLIQHKDIWSKKFRTILVVKSSKNKRSVLEIKKFFKNKLNYDELLFIEQNTNDWNLPIYLFDYNITYSPSIILIKDKKMQLFDYKFLYNGNYKNELKNRLKTLSEP